MTFRAGGDDGRLSRTVGIEDFSASPAPAFDQIRGASLAAQDEQPHGRHLVIHHRKERGNGRKNRDAGLGKQAREVWTGARHLRRADDEPGAREKGEPDFLHRSVKGDRKALIDPVIGLYLKNVRFCAHEMAGTPMLDLDALGPSSGAGSIDDVAEVLRLDAGFQTSAGFCGDWFVQSVKGNDFARESRDFCGQSASGHHGARPAIGQNEVDPFGWIIGIERHVSGSGFENRQQRYTDVY